MRLNDVALSALSALGTHRHGEEREPRHDVLKRGCDTIVFIRMRLLRRGRIVRPVLRRILGFVLRRGFMRALRSSVILRRRCCLRLIRHVIPALLQGIPSIGRRLLFLLRAAHPMHEHKLRSFLHIRRHDERSSCERCSRTRRLDEINLRMVADTTCARSTGGRKAENGRRDLYARQQCAGTADHRPERLLLRSIGGTKGCRIALVCEYTCGDLAPLRRVPLLLHRHKHAERIQQSGAKRTLCRIHRTDRRIGNLLDERQPVPFEAKRTISRTFQDRGQNILTQEVDLVHIEKCIACTVQQAVPQAPLAFLQGRLHVDCAEDHILRRSKRQFRNFSGWCKRCCRTDENGFCRAPRAGDQEASRSRVDERNRKCAPCVLLPDNGSQRITRSIQVFSSEKLFMHVLPRSHPPHSSRPPLPRKDGGAYGVRRRGG